MAIVDDRIVVKSGFPFFLCGARCEIEGPDDPGSVPRPFTVPTTQPSKKPTIRLHKPPKRRQPHPIPRTQNEKN